jgi:hypothetical protein
VTTTDTPTDEGPVDYVVDGVRILCDSIGPIRRLPCQEHGFTAGDDAEPHWWVWSRDAHSGTWWCNVGPPGGWRAHARRVA